jgi:transcriptional regulator with XRE-family HTH domain
MQFVSNRLIGARKAKGLSQEVLAEKTGASLRSVQNWEGGEYEPQPDHLRRLSAALDVSVAYLIGEDETSAPRREEAELREHPGESNEAMWRRRAKDAEERLEELRNALRSLLELSAPTRRPRSEPEKPSSSLPSDIGERVLRAHASPPKKGDHHRHS